VKENPIDLAMEDDRAQVDLGLAADIEASALLSSPSGTIPASGATKQPKKRFVGRRAANAAAAASTENGADYVRKEGENGGENAL
jgi:2-(3-amino-3-carboxypropyl)histidine synthase